MNKEKQIIEQMALAICKSRGVADVDDCRKCWQHENNCLYQDIAYGLYREDYRKQEWISVEERLPEKNGYYLVYTMYGYIEVERYKTWDDDDLDGGYWWEFEGLVTHWMPLPEPPKGGAK